MASAPKTEFGAWFASQQASGGTQIAGAIGAPAGTAATSVPGAPSSSILSSVASAFSGAAAGAFGSSTTSSTSSDGAASSADVEAARAGSSSASSSMQSIAAPLGALGAAVAGLLPGAASALPLASPVSPTAPPPNEWACGLSYAQRFQAFLLLGCGSVSLYFAAFFIFLPLVLLAPSKFATSFTFASILWLTAFALLRGPRTTVVSLLQRDKLPFTAAYVGSLVLSLWSTLVVQSYFLILLAVVVQASAAIWYTSSYIPGGTAAAGALGRMCLGTARSLVGSLFR
jgi:hypothetical protein